MCPDVSQHEGKTLTDLLDDLAEGITGEQVTVGYIVEKFQYRGFGPLLLLPSLIVILPTGAIPLVPAICGIVMGFVCLQMLFGMKRPWLPSRIENFRFSGKKLENGVRRVRPYIRKIDRMLHERMVLFVNPLTKRLIALICLVLCFAMILIGVIPMLPATLALPIFFFGLGYIAQDGLIIFIGFLMILGSGYSLYLI